MSKKPPRLITKHLSEQISGIMFEDALSAEELAGKAGISKTTIYSILAIERETTRVAIGRKIAEGTGREFKIEGDKIYFLKPETNSTPPPDLPEDIQEIIDLFPKLNKESQDSIIKLLRNLAK